MRHRHRPASGNLRTEQRHYRARRTQHIAKAHHAKTGCHARFGGQRLQGQLGQTFGCPHYIGRAHRLVGRDQYKRRHARFYRRTGRTQRTKGIVHDAFKRIPLHQRHMLVCRRVVHGIHPVSRHHFGHTLFVQYRAQHRQHGNIRGQCF